jgi:hypothetical protein
MSRSVTMEGNAERGRALQQAWDRNAETGAWSFYLVGLQAALSDPRIAHRMLADYEAAFGDTIIRTQSQADQTMQMFREYYKKQDARPDTLGTEEQDDGIPA